MQVLVTNDDGIDSAGLAVLANVAYARGHDVLVAAPAHQYSGASASLTGHETQGRLEMAPHDPPGLARDIPAFAVRATPALIVFTARYGAFGPGPDLVMSGVNLGANTGHATLHSGTVGAAMAGATQGIPGLAVSITSAEPVFWQTASRVVEVAFDWMVEHCPEGRVLNVNVPDVPLQQLRGMKAARLAKFGAVQAAVQERGEGWVHMTYEEIDVEHEPGTDAYLLTRGWATSSLLHTPIHDVHDPPPPEFTTEAVEREEEVFEVSRGQTMSIQRREATD